MKPRTRTQHFTPVGVSVFLHAVILGVAAHIGFGVGEGFEDELSVAVTPRFVGDPVAWVTNHSGSVAFAAEPTALTDALAELEPVLPDSFASAPARPEPVEPDSSSADPAPKTEEARVAPIELVEPDVFALGDLSLSSAEPSGAGADAGTGSASSTAGEPGEQVQRESRPVGGGGAVGGATAMGSAGAARTGHGSPGGGASEGVAAARLVDAPQPVYPRLSVRAGEEGTVRCRLHIAADGHVVSVDVVETSGYPRLDRAAVDALLSWRFFPRRVDEPKTILHQVTFRLEES